MRQSSQTASMTRALENLDRAGNWLVEDIGNILADSEALLMAASEVAGVEFALVRAQFERRITSARAALSDALRHAFDLANETAARADRSIIANPWAAVGASMAAGVLVGLLASRCSSTDAGEG
jgi:ElaB/YqjD/DUF883 family membrane-anchored ribosome-binding protein